MDTVEQVELAMTHEPWEAGLIEADDPVAYFFDNLDNIIEERQRGDGNKEGSASPMYEPPDHVA
ncbi:MAG: hypothetical protein JWQ49_2027 [Edaphobacter sp.]|nr:hypothetical protein [Edaphobacter sp.]